MQKFTKELIIAFLFGVSVIVFSNVAFAETEWRQKPVQCGKDESFFQILNQHGERAMVGGLSDIRDPDESGPTIAPVYLFVNTETGTFTIAEFHLARNEVCVIGFGNGIDFDVDKLFLEKYKKKTGT